MLTATRLLQRRAWRNFTETQQSDHAPRPGPEVKKGRSGVKDGTPERLRCGTIQKEVKTFSIKKIE